MPARVFKSLGVTVGVEECRDQGVENLLAIRGLGQCASQAYQGLVDVAVVGQENAGDEPVAGPGTGFAGLPEGVDGRIDTARQAQGLRAQGEESGMSRVVDQQLVEFGQRLRRASAVDVSQ